MWTAIQIATAPQALLAPTACLLELSAAEDVSFSAQDKREVAYLMLATLAALVTLLMFILGIFVMKRIGARLRSHRIGGEPTTYVDTWSQYRLSEDEIAAATAEDESQSTRHDTQDDEDHDASEGETR